MRWNYVDGLSCYSQSETIYFVFLLFASSIACQLRRVHVLFVTTFLARSAMPGRSKLTSKIAWSTMWIIVRAKEKCWKKVSIFYFLCPRCTINSDWSKTSERRLKSKFFRPSLDQLRSTFQKSIFKAVFWVCTQALDPGASDGHQEDGLVDHVR